MPTPIGKPDPGAMAYILRNTGRRNGNVLVGPRRGVDFAVLRVGRTRVLIASADPVSFIPSLGPRDSAWLSVHAAASDIATSGVAPSHAMFELNLPPSMSDVTLKAYWEAIHIACRDLRIAILGGHTGRFQGSDYTVVGGVTMLAFASTNGYVTAASAGDGDDIIATKSAAVEATAVLSRTFPKTLVKDLGGDVVAGAQALLKKTSVVEDARVAVSVGLRQTGVTAMHDVTEGGVLNAILELANASSLTATIQAEDVPVLKEVGEVCRFFHIDPLISLGQGSLIIASRPQQSDHVMRALKRKGIGSRIVGRLSKGGTSKLVSKGKTTNLAFPKSDPYWRAYWTGIKKGLG